MSVCNWVMTSDNAIIRIDWVKPMDNTAMPTARRVEFHGLENAPTS